MRATTSSHVFARFRDSDDLKEQAKTDLVLSAVFVAVALVWIVMFVGLYDWSRYAPVFAPEGAGGPQIEEPMPQ